MDAEAKRELDRCKVKARACQTERQTLPQACLS